MAVRLRAARHGPPVRAARWPPGPEPPHQGDAMAGSRAARWRALTWWIEALGWWIEALGWWRGTPRDAMTRVGQGPPAV